MERPLATLEGEAKKYREKMNKYKVSTAEYRIKSTALESQI